MGFALPLWVAMMLLLSPGLPAPLQEEVPPEAVFGSSLAQPPAGAGGAMTPLDGSGPPGPGGPGAGPMDEGMPAFVRFSTMFGGNGTDWGFEAVRNDRGEVVLVGCTDSEDLPATADAPQKHNAGAKDGLVAKLSANGSELLFLTYLGGRGDDLITSVAIDDEGLAHVAGVTNSTDFPTSPGCFQSSLAGGYDAFSCRLDIENGSVEHSTLVGGSGNESKPGEGSRTVTLSVDGSGRDWLVGATASDDLPTTGGCYQDTLGGATDAFACRLSADGSALERSTYLGGASSEIVTGSCLSSGGGVYVVGGTTSRDFPTTARAYQDVLWGGVEGFVTRLSSDGSSLDMSTLLGDFDDDLVYAVKEGSGGKVHITGYTDSQSFPTTSGAYQEHIAGGCDGFVCQLAHDGSSLDWSTLVGGSEADLFIDLCLDTEGILYTVGVTTSDDFPTEGDPIQNRSAGDHDVVVCVVDDDGDTVPFSTYLGGWAVDIGSTIHLDDNNSMLVSGTTASWNFPTTEGAYRRVNRMGEAFLLEARLDLVPPLADAGEDVIVDQHQVVTFDGTRSSDDQGILNWTWDLGYNGSATRLYGPSPSFTFHLAGHYVVGLRVTDAGNNTARDEVNVTVRDITPPRAVAGGDFNITQHEQVTFDGGGSSDNVGVVNWTWTLGYRGANVSLHGPVASFTFDDAGVFNVTLRVADAAGLSDTDRLWVHVADTTSPVAEAGPDLVVDQHGTAVLDGSRSTDNAGITNWTWTFTYGGEVTTLLGEVASFTFDEAGTYEVVLRVEDADGNRATDALLVFVEDTTPPRADAGPDVEVDQGTMVRLNGSGSADNVRVGSYRWTFEYAGMVMDLEGPEPDFFFAEAGEYVVELTVTDAAGHEASDTMEVTVRDTEAPVPVPGEDLVVDQGDTVRFDGSGSSDNVGVVDWRWAFTYGPDGRVLEGPTPSFVFELAGVFLVNLTVSDAWNNSGHATMTVTVRDTTAPVPVAGADLWVDQGTEVALNGSASTDNVGIQRYKWLISRGGPPVPLSGPVVAYRFDAPGEYTVALTVTDPAGNSASDRMTVRVRDTEPPKAAGEASRDVRAGGTCSFDASSSRDNVGIASYRWTFEEGGTLVELEGERAEHAFEEAGVYEVTLTVTDADGNSDTETLEVRVRGWGDVYALLAVLVFAGLVTLLALLRRRRGRSGRSGRRQ